LTIRWKGGLFALDCTDQAEISLLAQQGYNYVTETSTDFGALNLPNYLLNALADAGYNSPTLVQQLAIPRIRAGGDIIVEAQTGTGKTASFALPIIEKVNHTSETAVHTLVLAPTRELAEQVGDFFKRYAKYSPKKVKIACVIGGRSHQNQVNDVANGAAVVVATPGRLGELLRAGEISFEELQVLVIDEADKLLNLGFASELGAIINELPEARETLLFSATFPEKVTQLAGKIMTSPSYVAMPGESPTVEKIEQRIILVDRDNRRMLLQHLIQTEKWDHCLVFVSSKKAAGNLAQKLRDNGVKVAAFHGDLSSQERDFSLELFKKRKVNVLTATDIAARGIDFLKLSHVVNFDLPRSPSDYVHRIGRTGRAGHEGVAVSFVTQDNVAHFELIEKRNQLTLRREQVPGFELTGDLPAKQKGLAAVKGKRPSKKDKLRKGAKNSGSGLL